MPRISDVSVLFQSERPILSIRTRTTSHDLPMLIGASFQRLAAYLEELNAGMADMPFVAYYSFDTLNLDVEIGIPVMREFPDHASIRAGHLSQGAYVSCFYQGPYQDIPPVYNEMCEWLLENGYEKTGVYYEYYYNGPPYPERQWLTKLVLPIRKLH